MRSVKELIEEVIAELGLPASAAGALHRKLTLAVTADDEASLAKSRDVLLSRGTNIKDIEYATELLGEDLRDVLMDPNAAERRAQIGARLRAGTGNPANPSNRSIQQGASNMSTGDRAKVLKGLKLELAEWDADPKNIERMELGQRRPDHPLYLDAKEKRDGLIKRIAANEAILEQGAEHRGRTSSELNAELKKLQADPQFMAEFQDARHFRHAERQQQRQALIEQIAAAEQVEALGRNPGRSAATIHREIAELRGNADFQRDTIGKDARHPEYRAAMDKHSKLVGEFAAASSGESTAALHAAAEGTGGASDAG